MKSKALKPGFYPNGSFLVLLLIVAASSIAQAQSDGIKTSSRDTAMQMQDFNYFGYEIAVGVQQYQLKSDVSKINGMSVTQRGASVGVKFANQYTAVRIHGGLFYGDAEMPYSVDMTEAAISGNFYFLKWKDRKAHTFEPYVVGSLRHQRAKFYGSYLGDRNNNLSHGSEPLLGIVTWWKLDAGFGVDFQMENEKLEFIHFFAEARYGLAVDEHGSNGVFANTTIKSPMVVSFGMSFGKFK